MTLLEYGHIVLVIVTSASLPFAFRYLNRIRGDKESAPLWKSKSTGIFAMAGLYAITLAVAALPNTIWQWGLIAGIAVVFRVVYAFGLGKYYPHGQDKHKEKEFWPATIVANMVVGVWDKPMPKEWAIKWQTVGMSARWGITLGCILIPYISYTVNNLYILPLMTAMWYIGIIYKKEFTPFKSDSTERSEIKTGFFLGCILFLCNVVIAIT